ncbi:hypothetical protein BST61_g1183 [Cercospora zeina]
MPNSCKIENVLATPIAQAIDPDIVKDIVSGPPFVHIPGTFNARDIGNDELLGVRSGFVFRSGTFENANDTTLEALRSLNITTIYDLRTFRETILIHSSLASKSIGDQNVNIHQEYAELMRSHAPKLEAVFRHLLEQPNKPLLFHCFAAQTRDYDLTRAWIEPVRELLLAKVLSYGNLNLDDPKVKQAGEFADLTAFMIEVTRKFGGVEAYVKNHLGFTHEEVEQIRQNLRTRPSEL